MPLVDFDRIKENIPGLATTDTYAVGRIQAAVEATVEKYCGRRFAEAAYDELQNGTGDAYLFVDQRPIVSIASIRYGLLPGVWIVNNSTDNHNATVAVTSTGLTLTRFYNGTSDDNVIAFEDAETFTAVANAINALGNGWSAGVGGSDIGGWASADLAAYPGTFGAWHQQVNLLFHRWFLQAYRFDANRGEIQCPAGWPRGYRNIRVQYTAGYSTIPDDLQGVICEMTRSAWQSTRVNSNLASESLGGYSYSLAAQRGLESLSLTSRKTLELYRSYDLARWR